MYEKKINCFHICFEDFRFYTLTNESANLEHTCQYCQTSTTWTMSRLASELQTCNVGRRRRRKFYLFNIYDEFAAAEVVRAWKCLLFFCTHVLRILRHEEERVSNWRSNIC